jgi:hypothetical protein
LCGPASLECSMPGCGVGEQLFRVCVCVEGAVGAGVRAAVLVLAIFLLMCHPTVSPCRVTVPCHRAVSPCRVTTPCQGGHLLRSMLDPMDTYILDCGAEVFVCIGRGSEPEEKITAMMNAQVGAGGRLGRWVND